MVVNGPEPVSSLLDLGPDGLAAAMGVWRERMRFHAGAGYVHVIVNEGRQAGASLPHTHAQLYALPFVPSAVARERERFTAYRDRTQGRNLLADLVQEEVRRRERLVAVDSEAVRICPFASRVPFHVQLVPRTPAPALRGRRAARCAALLHDVLGRLAAALGGVPPLNLWVRTAPRGRRDASAGGSTCCPGWPTPPGWRWAPGCSCACWRPSGPPRRCASTRPLDRRSPP